MTIRIFRNFKQKVASLFNKMVFWISIWVLTVAIIWIIVIFAVTPQIANAIAATATLTLAIAAFLAIWQNRNLQRKERRERLLNEIIEWAINITSINYGGEITATPGVSGKILGRVENVNRLLGCQLLEVKGREIIEKSASTINQDLGGAVNSVLNSLNVVIGVLRQGVPYDESKEAESILKANDISLEENIRNLLKETSKHREY